MARVEVGVREGSGVAMKLVTEHRGPQRGSVLSDCTIEVWSEYDRENGRSVKEDKEERSSTRRKPVGSWYKTENKDWEGRWNELLIRLGY